MNATVDEAVASLTGIPTFGVAVIEDPPSARADHEGEDSSEVVAVTPNEAAATLPNEWAAVVERSKTDPGAPFERDALARLAILRADHPADWQRFMALLKKDTVVRVGDLERRLDRTCDAASDTTQGRALEWYEPEPWPEPVAGDMLLSDIAEFLRRYVAMSKTLADTVALWTVATWLHDGLELSTFLNVTSATKRCGKSLLMEAIGCLVHRPLPVSGRITPAALFRIIERDAPTMLLDEADTSFGNDPELRGIVNGSQRRDSASLLRCVGEDYEPRRFVTWCPKAIAGIGGLPDTVVDRAVVVRLERRPPGVAVESWRTRDREAIGRLASQIARWIQDHRKAVLAWLPEVTFPERLHDRARDAWESLFAIAEVAGGDWAGTGGRAWRACEHVNADADDETGAREMLLADLRTVFREAGEPQALTTKQILQALIAMEGRPWSEWNRGKPLSSHGLSRLLKPFGIRPRVLRISRQGTPRGYRRESLEPVWGAYFAQEGGDRSATPQQTPETRGFRESQSATTDLDVADTKSRKALENGDCCSVADQTSLSPVEKVEAIREAAAEREAIQAESEASLRAKERAS